jgi:hypothetical protein
MTSGGARFFGLLITAFGLWTQIVWLCLFYITLRGCHSVSVSGHFFWGEWLV